MDCSVSKYFYIQQWKKDEQERDVTRDCEDDMVFSDEGGFTLHDWVPTVNVYELEEDDFNDENDVGV